MTTTLRLISFRGLPLLAAIAALTPSSRAEILSAEYTGGPANLTEVGTIDWAVFGPGGGAAAGEIATAVDWKKDGKGIARSLKVKGDAGKLGGDGFTKLSYRWKDGAVTATADGSGSYGLSTTLKKDGAIALEFAAAGEGEVRMASVGMRQDGPLIITARQGAEAKTVEDKGSWFQVQYSGAEPLTIEIATKEAKGARVRGFIATLSESGSWHLEDGRWAFFFKPPTRAELEKRAAALPPIDYLKEARAFADCIVAYGRDRYGKVKSPLFANTLTREKEPTVTPYPLFGGPPTAEQRAKWAEKKAETEAAGRVWYPYVEFDFNDVLNYPRGMGSEGPHKTTLTGADVFDGRDLFDALFEISRVTGEAKYKEEADKSLTWWFANTQSEAGLYPWGEHLSWDFVDDAPLYTTGPMKHFWEATCHEVRDDVPFMEHLLALPAGKDGLRPIEKYALGIWQAHFWDKENVVWCRHADYYGSIMNYGSGASFANHAGFYLRVMMTAYGTTQNDAVRTQLHDILHKMLDSFIVRTERWGFLPDGSGGDIAFRNIQSQMGVAKAANDTAKLAQLEAEMKQVMEKNTLKNPGRAQRLVYHALDVLPLVEKQDPELAEKLRKLAKVNLYGEAEELSREKLKAYKAAGGGIGPAWIYLMKAGEPMPAEEPELTLKDLSKNPWPEGYAKAIREQIKWHRSTGNREHLKLAEQYARLAHVSFMDGTSPLPKAMAVGAPLKTSQGEPFPDFYFVSRGCADLMRAYALLGEALAGKTASN